MILKSIKVKNWQLFESAEINLGDVNIISGINKDTPAEDKSGNGSGKSALILRAVLFALYGFAEEGVVLKDFLRFSETNAEVTIEIKKDSKTFVIVRKIPTELQVFVDNNEIQANTNSVKQSLINDTFGDINFFRQYRLADNSGIDLLGLGNVSLKKTLMGFVEDIFTNIRKNLLAEKTNRERYSVDKKLYKHYLSENRKSILKTGLDAITKQINELKSMIREAQSDISKINGEVSAKKRIINYKEAETKKAERGICPILRVSCDRIGKKLSLEDKNKLNQEILNFEKEVKQLKESIIGDEDYLADLEMQLQELDGKKEKIRRASSRLENAFQFAEYKFTTKDVAIYTEAIKSIDSFASYYIKEWLSDLSTIINNLLNPINLSVEFTDDKQFIKVKDNGQEFKFGQLSSGQKAFLSTIFKLGILMLNNKTGLVIMDDSLNNIDWNNFKRLVEIIKTLPFQVVMIFQNLQENIEGATHFQIIRKNGKSEVKNV